MTTQIQPNLLHRLDINTDIGRKMIVGFIRDQVEKTGMKRAVMGLSGGIDSALSAYLSAEALGAENVLVVPVTDPVNRIVTTVTGALAHLKSFKRWQ